MRSGKNVERVENTWKEVAIFIGERSLLVSARIVCPSPCRAVRQAPGYAVSVKACQSACRTRPKSAELLFGVTTATQGERGLCYPRL